MNSTYLVSVGCGKLGVMMALAPLRQTWYMRSSLKFIIDGNLANFMVWSAVLPVSGTLCVQSQALGLFLAGDSGHNTERSQEQISVFQYFKF